MTEEKRGPGRPPKRKKMTQMGRQQYDVLQRYLKEFQTGLNRNDEAMADENRNKIVRILDQHRGF